MNYNFLLNPITTIYTINNIRKNNKKANIAFALLIVSQIQMYLINIINIVLSGIVYKWEINWSKDNIHIPLNYFFSLVIGFLLTYVIYLIISFSIAKKIILLNQNEAIVNQILNNQKRFMYLWNLITNILLIATIIINTYLNISIFEDKSYGNITYRYWFYAALVLILAIKVIFTNIFNLIRLHKLLNLTLDDNHAYWKNNLINLVVLYTLTTTIIAIFTHLSIIQVIYKSYVYAGWWYHFYGFLITPILVSIAIILKWLISFLVLRKAEINISIKLKSIFLVIMY
ncbi:Uncharacterised protein [Metamycoplasma cloacale]|uniref:Uncharacterized protein n=1 Tax=Metamycoplasma cloacale TaxID=92401 RepID=A0A2Z4LMC9_9BACT|nr:hypothetical protein [Metamycoplasma cloacale]AWX42923.1 hypothetical protein DK849_02540 [Metamycoplasma cloacale]VEU79253.1 Uncharacterised protein [Metamycoplasma cloacale]